MNKHFFLTKNLIVLFVLFSLVGFNLSNAQENIDLVYNLTIVDPSEHPIKKKETISEAKGVGWITVFNKEKINVSYKIFPASESEKKEILPSLSSFESPQIFWVKMRVKNEGDQTMILEGKTSLIADSSLFNTYASASPEVIDLLLEPGQYYVAQGLLCVKDSLKMPSVRLNSAGTPIKYMPFEIPSDNERLRKISIVEPPVGFSKFFDKTVEITEPKTWEISISLDKSNENLEPNKKNWVKNYASSYSYKKYYSFEPIIKKDKDSSIILLEQSFFAPSESTEDTLNVQFEFRIFNENYKKNRYWTVTQTKPDESSIWKSYLPDGKLWMKAYGKELQKERKSLIEYQFLPEKAEMYEYYLNGNLKYIMEYNQKGQFNILEYYYPDGKPYNDYGDFKNGAGTYKILDDNGVECKVCSEKDQKTKNFKLSKFIQSFFFEEKVSDH